MGNACTNCSACKGDGGENGEILTVDHKVSFFIKGFNINNFFIHGNLVWAYETVSRINCKCIISKNYVFYTVIFWIRPTFLNSIILVTILSIFFDFHLILIFLIYRITLLNTSMLSFGYKPGAEVL